MDDHPRTTRQVSALTGGKFLPQRSGWGLRIRKVRNTTGISETLILPADHEAPFWTDLRQIAQHQARTIHQPR